MFHPLPGVVDHRSVGAPVAESTLALALLLLTNGRSLFWEWQDSVLNSFNHFAWKLAWDKTQASKVLNVKVMIIFPDALQANCSSESSSQSNKYTKCHLTLVLSSAGFWVNRKGAQDTHLHCVVIVAQSCPFSKVAFFSCLCIDRFSSFWVRAETAGRVYSTQCTANAGDGGFLNHQLTSRFALRPGV